MPKLIRICACGREFSTYPSIDKRHCSMSCSLRYQPRKPRRGESLTCETCGIAIYRNQSVKTRGRGRFCSAACHNTAQTKTPVVKHCAWCGTEMRLKPSQSRVQYCSKEHEGLARIKRPMERIHNGRPAKQDNYGYVMLWEPMHPNKSMKGWQYEHRLVMEQAIGRFLKSDEQVDHINQVKDDNRLENLQVLSVSEHSRKTGVDRKTAAELIQVELAEYRRRYGPLNGGS